jgi:hypothetical protein
MKNKKENIFNKNQDGFLLVLVMVMANIFIVMAGGLASLGIYQYKLYLQQGAKHKAMHIAEAGANYYRWHLAHNHDDYYNGTGADPGAPGEPYGPYINVYTDPSTGETGTFSLEITPPPAGSTIVKIKSTGWLNSYPNIKRSLEVRYGIPTLAHFSFLTHSDAWFGPDENIRGEAHTNGGFRIDGPNDSVLTSARATYTCTSVHGCTQANCANPCQWASNKCSCPGIWGAGPNYNLWQYPVPIIDFNSISLDIAQIKTDAQASGVYLGNSPKGYHIVFQANGTFNVYKISQLKSSVRQYNEDTWSGWVNIQEEIENENYDSNHAIPANGLIFVEDNVWIDGVVNGRATLVAAKLPDNPNNRKSIYINNNLTYLDRNDDILGLIAQKHIKVPRYAPANLTIDAILLAQNGRVFHNYYSTHSVKNNIEVYGGVITNLVWTWTWTSGGVAIDGYSHTTSIYDSKATYAPPPSFPTTGEYAFISWEEK